MQGTFLITSGAYAGAEFVSIFGRLPPAFLPVGNRRLYEHQARAIEAFKGRKLLSLPDDFTMGEADRETISALGFEVVLVLEGLSLGASVRHVLDAAGAGEGELRILHGDTLIEGPPLDGTDMVSEGYTDEYYSWAEWRLGKAGAVEFFEGLPAGTEPRCVLTGYFSFSDAALLARSLEEAENGFIAGLSLYAQTRRLAPVPTGRWLDFGHLETYYKSRAHMTTERAFNKLSITRHVVAKSSADKAKMEAEEFWYANIPPKVKVFTPQFLGGYSEGDTHGYEIEHLYLSTLSDLYVFGRLPSYVWQRIFRACDNFLTECGKFPAESEEAADAARDAAKLYLPKTLDRLEEFAKTSGTDLDKGWSFAGRDVFGLGEIAELTAARIAPVAPEDLRILHGDFCFSNILYDFRANAIRLVDPRGGSVAGRPAIHGDPRYDIAKLYHSAVGGYDLIMAGRYGLEDDGAYALSLDLYAEAGWEERQAAFLDHSFAGLNVEAAQAPAISVLLFLSMLPLHGDAPERQRALLANALRLFLMLGGGQGG